MLTFLNSVFNRGKSVAETRKNYSHDTTRPSITAAANYARFIYDNYRTNDGASLPSLLMRQFDMRLCSMTTYYLMLDLFGNVGDTFVEQYAEVIEALNLKLRLFPSGRLSEVGTSAAACMPASYRGFGSPIYDSSVIGHLFRINLSAFDTINPLIGIQDWTSDDNLITIKGMRPAGKHNQWKLFELDPNLTDDCTALLVVDTKTDLQLEMINLSSGRSENEMEMFYSFSTHEGIKPDGAPI
ncbi:MAG: hypothetical protein K2M01_03175 [Paramuribaculum sp.]|nr:hypothetical protein [Paramuribaculum sp.]